MQGNLNRTLLFLLNVLYPVTHIDKTYNLTTVLNRKLEKRLKQEIATNKTKKAESHSTRSKIYATALLNKKL